MVFNNQTERDSADNRLSDSLMRNTCDGAIHMPGNAGPYDRAKTDLDPPENTAPLDGVSMFNVAGVMLKEEEPLVWAERALVHSK